MCSDWELLYFSSLKSVLFLLLLSLVITCVRRQTKISCFPLCSLNVPFGFPNYLKKITFFFCLTGTPISLLPPQALITSTLCLNLSLKDLTLCNTR